MFLILATSYNVLHFFRAGGGIEAPVSVQYSLDTIQICFNCKDVLSKINIVSGTSLGIRIDGKDLVDNNYITAVNELLVITVTRINKPWLMVNSIFNLSSYKTKLTEALAVVSKLSMSVSICLKKILIYNNYFYKIIHCINILISKESQRYLWHLLTFFSI